MTTNDLQQIDELVHMADVAVRVASQLRLWLKRRELRDGESVEAGIRFLDEAVRGGRFVDTGEIFAGSSSLYPLTWAADIRFGPTVPFGTSPTSVRYDDLVRYLDGLKQTLVAVATNIDVSDSAVSSATGFFDQLGRLLGGKADSALRSPAGGTQLLEDRFSFQ